MPTNRNIYEFIKTYGIAMIIIGGLAWMAYMWMIGPEQSHISGCSIEELTGGKTAIFKGKQMVVTEANDFTKYSGSYWIKLQVIDN